MDLGLTLKHKKGILDEKYSKTFNKEESLFIIHKSSEFMKSFLRLMNL